MSEVADRAASLVPGHGKVDLFGYADLGRVGAGLEATHAFTRNLAAFGQAWVGKERDEATGSPWRTSAGALAGLRLHW